MKKKANVYVYEFDPQIQEAIERNYRRAFGQSFKEREDRLRRQQKKERILSIFIGAFIIITTCILIYNGI